MLLVLDPALFLPERLGSPMNADERRQLALTLDEVVQICRTRQARIAGEPSYWRRIQALARPLRSLGQDEHGRRIDAAMDALGVLLEPLTRPPPVHQPRMWGVQMLFGPTIGPDWLTVMEQVLVRSVLADPVVRIVVRFVEGRNVRRHAVKGCELLENLRWRVQLHVPDRPPAKLDCIRSRRNLDIEWSIRMDDRLPATLDGGACPFCPPDGWWRRDVVVFRTRESRPAWIDLRDNAWARPSTGGGHHWDVYLAPPLDESIGLAQINIAQYDGQRRDRGKAPGDIHHMPEEKRARLRKEPRWSCE
jgi:hypothetical protein